jgi:hypothetical protein
VSRLAALDYLGEDILVLGIVVLALKICNRNIARRGSFSNVRV